AFCRACFEILPPADPITPIWIFKSSSSFRRGRPIRRGAMCDRAASGRGLFYYCHMVSAISSIGSTWYHAYWQIPNSGEEDIP
ncbi:MAG: hypothetical protein ABSD48_07230, partial [Armatimonadota bacterium]